MPTFSFENHIKIKKEKSIVRKNHHTVYGTFSKYGNDCAVYGIKCKITNKVYIGSTKHIQRRLMKHFSELHLNRHRAKQLQKEYNLYGKDAFEIIIYSNSSIDLLKIEKDKQLEIGIDNLYNEKISGVWIKDEYRQQLSKASKATHKTKEYREKMSKLKSNKIAQYTLDMRLVKIWDSALQVCEELGHTRSVILSCCNGYKLRAYGFNWRYITDNGHLVYDGYAKGRKKN